MHPRAASLALAVLALGGARASADVRVTRETDLFRVVSEGFTAEVGLDGALTSLRVAGAEFLESRDGFPRGAYAFQDGLLAMPEVSLDGTTVVAGSERALARWAFDEAGVTLSLDNRSEKPVLLVIVFPLALEGLRTGDDRYRKVPSECAAPSATWYRLPAAVTISGGERAWGPWGGGHQVWQATVLPGATGTIRFDAHLATDEESASVARERDRVIEPPTDPVGAMWDPQRFADAPAWEPAQGYDWAGTAEGVRPIFFDGPPFEGRPTKVFAWLGVPEVEAGTRLPGIVLVHGGGGSAFAHWVKMWNDRGYAAIAMDTCGCVPVGSYGAWQRTEFGGPEGWGGFGQISQPREDQWTFHAVASAVLAHSLLRALPEVDPARIGVTGISWGGYLTSLIAGVDARFAFAAPVYGCGFTLDMTFGDSVRALGEEGAARWMRWWDPSAYLPNARMPMLWVNGTNDFAYTMNGWQKSYLAAPGPHTLSIRLRMPHGHTEGEVPAEIGVFADSLTCGSAPLPSFLERGRDGMSVWARYSSAVPVASAELCFTKDRGPWVERPWETAPATLSEGRIDATLPEGAACWFLNLTDTRGMLVSTEHEELP